MAEVNKIDLKPLYGNQKWSNDSNRQECNRCGYTGHMANDATQRRADHATSVEIETTLPENAANDSSRVNLIKCVAAIRTNNIKSAIIGN